MGLILPLLLLGLMSSLSPTTIVVFILLLATARPRLNALAFLAGWAMSLTLVFYLSYAFAESYDMRHGAGRAAIAVLMVAVGTALIVAGARQWSHRDRTQAPAAISPSIEGRMRDLTPRSAVIVGILKQPWAITASAAIVVLSHHTAPIITLIAFASFTVVSTATVVAMYLYYTRRPDDATRRLDELRAAVTRNAPMVFAVVAVTVGLFLVADAIATVLTN